MRRSRGQIFHHQERNFLRRRKLQIIRAAVHPAVPAAAGKSAQSLKYRILKAFGGNHLANLKGTRFRPLRSLYQTVYFLPYVTNTLAVGLVFMILFRKTPYTDGFVNRILGWIGAGPIDFIDGSYPAKMFVLCLYTIWVVMPFKILVLTSALASVNQEYYNAAKVDGTSRFRIFARITLPMISPTLVYLIITGFIGAFKAYSDAVALFGTNLNTAEMNTIVGYVYDMLYGSSGGYPSYASAAAILLFVIVLTITCVNLMVSRKHLHYGV